MIEHGILVVLSGGQDSATCLSKARRDLDDWNNAQLLADGELAPLYTVSFNYGQRHKIELNLAEKLSSLAGAKAHFILPIPTFRYIGDSALVGIKGDIDKGHRGNDALPSSFVPGRNYIFLGFAAALAYKLGVRIISTGVCQTDYSGYPDCRLKTIMAIQESLRLAMEYEFHIETPLMHLTKAETIMLMESYDTLHWYLHTQTCYEGKRPPCGACPACKIRTKGFMEAGVVDPLLLLYSRLGAE